VSGQRGVAGQIERTAHEAARGVDMIEQRIAQVAEAANEADVLSQQVREAAGLTFLYTDMSLGGDQKLLHSQQ
jgi:methyl-accepting chemotaxis protein